MAQIVRKVVCATVLLAMLLVPMQTTAFSDTLAHGAAITCEEGQSCDCDKAKAVCSTAAACSTACSSLPMMAAHASELAMDAPDTLRPGREFSVDGHSPAPLRRPPRA